MRIASSIALLLLLAPPLRAQVLVDSIPYPGINQGFWGIWTNPDTVFIGADFSGDIYFSDHQGNILGQLPTGYNYNHGLIRRQNSYLIAKNYTVGGAPLHEIDLQGNPLNTWPFPQVIGGNPGGIGGLAADGDAVWFTVYHPDWTTYPYAYAYKWVPGTAQLLDTVPMNGRQPYGVTLKGDTLLYVIDNIHGDQERIYAYDLTNREDLFWFDIPDTPIDNDQSPRGLHYDGEFLYLMANRQGGSAFAYRTVFIYTFDEIGTGVVNNPPHRTMLLQPNPAGSMVQVHLPREEVARGVELQVIDRMGRVLMVRHTDTEVTTLDLTALPGGDHLVRAIAGGVPLATRKLVVQR
jgi:hypothetical protein